MPSSFVVLQEKDDAVKFTTTLLDDAGAPITTGSVTIDVLKPDGTAAVTAGAATHQGAGLWQYILAKTLFNVYGIWTAVWYWTVGATARQKRVLTEARYST